MNKFRTFPQIGSLIDDESLKEYPFYLRSYFCKSVVAKLKANISEDLLDKNTILEKIQQEIQKHLRKDLQSVINATGVVIHTNLGVVLLMRVFLKSPKMCFVIMLISNLT